MSMRMVRLSCAALLVAGVLATEQAPALHARPLTARVITMYLSSDAAFHTFDRNPSHAVAPPRVSKYPTGVQYIAAYFEYAGVSPGKTTFHVDYAQGRTVVRTGQMHTLGYGAGSQMLELPAQGYLSKGVYQAKLYVDGALATSTSFSLIRAPSITSSYMITGKEFDNFDTKSGKKPARIAGFPANVARVGIYYEYQGATDKDSYYGAVYDKNGKLVHRSHDHPYQYRPAGDLVLILPADSGAYPAGTYRTDIYINQAPVTSVTWTAK